MSVLCERVVRVCSVVWEKSENLKMPEDEAVPAEVVEIVGSVRCV